MNKKDQEIKQIITLAYENHRKKNLDLAESLYKKVLKLDSNYFDVIFLLGTLFLQKQNFEEAIKLFNKGLIIKPNDASTNNNLGHAYVQIGEAAQAKALFEKAIKIKPDHADALYNLANVHKHFGELVKAESYYKKALEIQPNNAKIYNNLGNILKDLGKFDEAIECYNKAIKIQYNHSNAFHNLGHTYKQLGKFDKAKPFFRKSLQYNPTNLETLLVLLELENEIIDFNLVKKTKEVIKMKNLSEKDIAYGNYILAKYEFQQKNFEMELEHLLIGHSHYFNFKRKLFKRGVKYWLEEIPSNKELINLGQYENRTKKNDSKISPIFIVGVPRCGSTLIEKVIASGEKKISIGEETAIISSVVGEHIKNKKLLNEELENVKIKIVEKFKEKKLLKKNDNVFTDKSLDNFFFIGLIKEIFPDAKVINCKRSPIASIVSVLKNNLGDVPWAHDLENIFKFFDNYHQRIEYFKTKYPNFIYDVQLENFVANPEKESKKLMQFCNLPWSKDCLEFHKRKDITSRTASNVQIRKGIYRESKDKHKPYKILLEKYVNKYNWFKH